MSPALQGYLEPDRDGAAGKETDPGKTPVEYQKDLLLWNTVHSDERLNPWHPNLDNTMFYL